MHFDEIFDQVEIQNPGQRREGTSSNIIFFKGGTRI